MEKYYNIGTDFENECFFIEYFDRTCFDYFFYHPIIIQYSFENNEEDNDKIEFNNIYSTEQIEKCNIDKNVKNPYIVLEPKNYKRIKNIKNNIKGFQINGFDKIIKNKKNNFIPMTLTDRNKQTNMDYHK